MRTLICLFVAIFILVLDMDACTAFSVYRDGNAIFANNEDYVWTNTYIEFIPAETGKYGRVYVGYAHIPSPQGGMNDQGLCFDTFGMPYLEVVNSVGLPYPPGDLKTIVMEQCATVEEVVAIFSMYNLTMMEYGQMIVSDRFGNTAIIEGDSIIYIAGDYQVCTNFYHSHPQLGGWPCWRYDLATDMLEEMVPMTMSRAKDIIFACQQTGSYGTTYTNLFDMNSGDIKVYCKGYFNTEISLNLFDELELGYSFRMIKDLALALGNSNNSTPGENPILQIYPNPTNSFTNFTYQISTPGMSELRIFDHTGQLVAILVEDVRLIGQYEIRWDASAVNPGFYYCQLTCGSMIASQKFVVIK